MDFNRTSLALAAEYREAGWAEADALRLAKGQTLIAKIENGTSLDVLRDVLRDLVRDLYDMEHPARPLVLSGEGGSEQGSPYASDTEDSR